jgi:predicted O-methyltransferase YrrM
LREELEEMSRSIPVDEGGGASLLKILVLAELIVVNGLCRIVEIGVYRGRLMLPLAHLMLRLGRGEMIGVDPYSAAAAVQREARTDGIDLVEWPSCVDWTALPGELIEAISRRGLGERAHLIRKRSRDAADAFAAAPIDMLHIDGNHDREAVEADVERFMPHMADGGLLVIDDVSWPTIRPVYESLVDEHEQLLALTEKGVNLRAGDFANDFSILRVRKTTSSPT